MICQETIQQTFDLLKIDLTHRTLLISMPRKVCFITFSLAVRFSRNLCPTSRSEKKSKKSKKVSDNNQRPFPFLITLNS